MAVVGSRRMVFVLASYSSTVVDATPGLALPPKISILPFGRPTFVGYHRFSPSGGAGVQVRVTGL